jgi:transcription-repair coupling factor (superfamily II helicase)
MRDSVKHIRELLDAGSGAVLNGLNSPSAAWFISSAAAGLNGAAVIVTPDQQAADRLVADLSFFSEKELLSYPCHDTFPFAPVLPSPEVTAARLGVLHRLSEGNSADVLLVMPAQALAELTIPRAVLNAVSEYVEAGEECDRDALLEWFPKSGYEHVSIVSAPGEFCARGGIVDFFPPGTGQPVRLDFFDNIIEEIRLFDPLTQRSGGHIESLVIIPASEVIFTHREMEGITGDIISAGGRLDWPGNEINRLIQSVSSFRITEQSGMLLPIVYPEHESIVAYITGLPLFVMAPTDVELELEQFLKRFEEAWEGARMECRTLVPAGEGALSLETIRKGLSRSATCFINLDVIPDREMNLAASVADLPVFETDMTPPELPVHKQGRWKGEELFAPVVEKLLQLVEQGNRVAIVLHGEHQAKRVLSLFQHYDVDIPAIFPTLPESPPSLFFHPEKEGIYLFRGRLSGSFMAAGQHLVVLTEDAIFQSGLRRRREPYRRPDHESVTWSDLKPGIHIVHKDHGIGIYRGLVRMETGGIAGEYLLLEYLGGDRLYLPVDRLALVGKYRGVEGQEPRLDKLGGAGWKSRTGKVRKAIHAVAHELVELYAGRQVREGYAFSRPSAMYRQFEADFPYEETADQLVAIEEILSDMQERRPMDRLLCGDVGFGKTEVIMRAAFKAVEDGKQVAVLVPTTLLAEQHERTFKRRFRRFPVRIEALSRIKTRKEQTATVKNCASGIVDIVIGTHRLLQQDIRFRDLGLLVIDEEHRFGVAHKEKLKKMRQDVDCISLTATPIPRTLQLSLLGIRDMSTITTPPGNRMAVKTYLSGWSNSLVRGAIRNELERNGQVFLVHNRVKGIESMAESVARLVPDARVEVAHGRMDGRELEEIMLRFVRGEIDCLVSTTIIESGIDIPSANTIIINRADRIGLAALYQLRGRVGRSVEQAYAYLIVPELSMLSPTARKRLSAIMDISRSGGGFRLAMKDLQIRGAGNILGVSQSGQIADVGYDLYLDLLKKAIDELRGVELKEKPEPEANLNIPALIPDDYVPDIEQRLHLYRKFSMLTDEHELPVILEEMEDRFGAVPQEVRNLAGLVSIKLMLGRENVVRLDRALSGGSHRIIITFSPDGPRNPEAVIAAVSSRKKWKLLPDNRLVIEIAGATEPEAVIAAVKNGIMTLRDAQG